MHFLKQLSSRITALFVRRGIGLTLLGIAIGIAGGLGLTRVIVAQLHGVKATDPITFVSVSLLLLIVALFACRLPAPRATNTDPMIVLRTEGVEAFEEPKS